MNDEQNHNDPIERLFREKAGEYDISYREEDWLKLEKKLDARDLKLYYRRRLRWLAAASILLISLIGYYTYQNHSKLNQLAEQLNQEQRIEQRDNQPNNPGNPEPQLDTLIQTPPSQQQTPGGNGSSNGETDSGMQNLAQNAVDEEPEVTVDENESGEAEPVFFAEAGQVISRKSLEETNFLLTSEREVLSISEPFEPAQRAHNDLNVSDISLVADNESSGGFHLLSDDEEQVYHSARSKLAVGVVISPDLSTAGSISNFYDPGFKGGLLVEYSLGKNFSLVSGVSVSNVKYKATANEYNPPQAWNYGIMPDQTTAVCMVLDIPVNLKANLFNFDRSRIFASAGISSYIMLNEDYQFRYNGDAAGLQTSWSERTGSRHWLSNAGFSVGFEYDLSPKWAFRAEPHLKIPLKGVGWGDVELYSLGSFLSLNYRFGR